MTLVGGRRCVVCGSPNATCGPATHTTPIDFDTRRDHAVAELKIYDVEVGYDGRRRPVRTQMRLTEAEAARLGATLAEAAKAAPSGDGEAKKPARRGVRTKA